MTIDELTAAVEEMRAVIEIVPVGTAAAYAGEILDATYETGIGESRPKNAYVHYIIRAK